MKKSKLEIYTQVRNEFANSTTKDANFVITLLNILKFFYSDLGMFICLIPFFIPVFFMFDVTSKLILTCVITHFICWKFILKGHLCKDNPSQIEEFNVMIQAFKDIKSEKETK